MIKSILSFCTIATLTSTVIHAAVSPIPGGSVSWDGNKTSTLVITVGEGATLSYHARGIDLELTGGVGGATFAMSDSKGFLGRFKVDAGLFGAMSNPTYGGSAISGPGQISSGSGTFDVSLTGFLGVDDIQQTISAALVTDGTDNAFDWELSKQGDQVVTANPGSVSYSSKWTSTDSFALSNGDVFAMNDFYLNTVGAPSALEYTFDGTNFDATYTVSQQYLFVDDLALDASGANLLFSTDPLDGTVSGIVSGTYSVVPVPAAVWLFGSGLIALIGLARRKA